MVPIQKRGTYTDVMGKLKKRLYTQILIKYEKTKIN